MELERWWCSTACWRWRSRRGASPVDPRSLVRAWASCAGTAGRGSSSPHHRGATGAARRSPAARGATRLAAPSAIGDGSGSAAARSAPTTASSGPSSGPTSSGGAARWRCRWRGCSGRRGRDLLAEADVVAPVPLHWRRRWRRGFDQAADLCRLLDVPVAKLLRRRRATVPQTGLSAAARRANVTAAFECRVGWWTRRERCRGLTVVLVDDVVTTGATLDACARVLRAAGARRVWGLTIARTPGGSPPRRPPRPASARRPDAATWDPRRAGGSSP